MSEPQPITVQGRIYPSAQEAARVHQVKWSTFRKRLSRGWSIERSLGLESAPLALRRGPRPIEISGQQFQSTAEAARRYGIPALTLIARLDAGIAPEVAVQAEGTPDSNSSQPVMIRGVSYGSVSAAAAAFGIPASTVRRRLNLGWTPDEAVGLSKPSSRGLPVRVAGREFPSVAQAARHYGIASLTAQVRLYAGWTPEQAFGVDPAPGTVCLKGKSYPSFSAAVRAHGLTPDAVRARMGQIGLTLEEAVDYKPHSRPRRPAPTVAERPEYLITSPEGQQWRVRDLRRFAIENGMERDALRALARAKDESLDLNGWRSRPAESADRATPAWTAPSV